MSVWKKRRPADFGSSVTMRQAVSCSSALTVSGTFTASGSLSASTNLDVERVLLDVAAATTGSSAPIQNYGLSVLGPTSVPTTITFLYNMAAPVAGVLKHIAVQQAGSSTGPAHVNLYASTDGSVVFFNTSLGTTANLARFEGRGGLTLVGKNSTAWVLTGYYQSDSSSDSNIKFMRST